MTKIFRFIVPVLIVVLLFSVSVSADSPAAGSWMLDTVYENAGEAGRTALDPENAASLYAESDNIYTILADGIAEMTMEGITFYGTWEAEEDRLRMVLDRSAAPSDQNTDAGPDIDPPYEMSFVYDEALNVLHRYWKEESPDASYHDLDFVYTKIPQGVWRMTKVYNLVPGAEPVLLDPESSQSLYAESVNTLYLEKTFAEETVPAGPEDLVLRGILEKAGGAWSLKFEDGYEAQLYYDAEADVLHRYWVELATDSPYQTLDFVYEKEER